jgi:hypothetical protein
MESAHSTWELTEDFDSTEEEFGLVLQASLTANPVPDDLKAEIVEIVDAYKDSTLDDSDDDLAKVALQWPYNSCLSQLPGLTTNLAKRGA